MNDNAPIQGSLEQLGISLETQIEDSVLTSGTAKNVRFHSVRTAHSSKPLGYSFGEVDKFVQDIVIPSLEWYQNTLHKRDKEIHILGGELDQATANVTGLQKQIDSVKYNSNIQQGLQSYQEDKETGALLQKLQELEEENSALKAGGGTGELSEDQVKPYLDAISERDEYIANLTTQYEELYDAYSLVLEEKEQSAAVETTSESDMAIVELNEKLATLQGELTDTQTSLVVRETENETLKNQLAAVTTELNAANSAPTNEETVTQLNTQLEENATQYQELLDMYERDTAKLTSDANELQNEIVTLQASLVQAGPTDATPDNDEYIASLTDHVNTITEQYSELEAKYVALYEEHSNLLATGAGSNSNEDLSDDGYTTSELTAYIAQITEQYNELLARYSELQEQQSSSTNSAEIGQLKVALESKDAEIARLEFELEEYKELEEEEPVKPKTMPMLLTEEKKKGNTTPLPPQFGNLPEGIRPEDLA